MTKYKFLEFDSYDTKLEKIAQSECECWADWKYLSEKEKDETIDGYYKMARHQHSKDAAIFKQLIEIIEMQNETIEDLKGWTVSYGMTTRSKAAYKSAEKATDTIAAVENKLKELSK